MRYRKVATVEARVAETGGTIDTLEGVHTYEAGDYICGPGAAGEFWPVKRAIFEATYVPAGDEWEDHRDPFAEARDAALAEAVEALNGLPTFDWSTKRDPNVAGRFVNLANVKEAIAALRAYEDADKVADG